MNGVRKLLMSVLTSLVDSVNLQWSKDDSDSRLAFKNEGSRDNNRILVEERSFMFIDGSQIEKSLTGISLWDERA